VSQSFSNVFARPRLQSLDCELLADYSIKLSMLRLDEMHPHLGGNKWFKLRPNIERLQREGLPLAVSFGGAWSNHLRALAAAGKQFGFATLGFVRGERVEPLNPVLAFAQQCGMELRFLSRGDYQRRHEDSFVAELCRGIGPHLLIPEGGSNLDGVLGCTELASYLEWPAGTNQHWVALACGTGTTMAGLVRGLEQRFVSDSRSASNVLGISVLKAPGYIAEQVSEWLGSAKASAEPTHSAVSWEVYDEFHCGGYARSNGELQGFLQSFIAETAIPIEPVYTGKLLYGIWQLIKSGRIPPESAGIVLHTGGVMPKNGKNSHKSV
jgi:1-aminocyclopropane-1-carboxylate deaminase